MRPILWNVMKYYAHYGHNEFILCLGYKADCIKRYFLEYDECITNDFTLSNGGKEIHLARTDISDWKITFVDTGLDANLGQRLRVVREHLASEKMFLANYADGVTDMHLPSMIEEFESSGAIGSFVSVRPQQSFHMVRVGQGAQVTAIDSMASADLWLNGGFFAFKQEVLEHIYEGEELVCEPFSRLIAKNALITHRHQGFWASMDTLKDKQMLEALHAEGRAPWEVWNRSPGC